jgi:hypothetical protein
MEGGGLRGRQVNPGFEVGGRRGVCVSLVSQAQAEKETTARTRAASSLAGLEGQARKKRELLVRARLDT